MLHRVSSSDVQELNRVLELIQRPGNAAPTPSNAQNSSSPSGGSGSSVFGSTATGATGPAGPAGVNGTTATMIVGADLIPEILLDANHNVLTDENGYALIGIHVSSSILTGAGVSSIEVLSGP